MRTEATEGSIWPGAGAPLPLSGRSAPGREPATLSRAILLAGGESTALGPLTEARPKSLLPVVNRALIEWQLEALRRNGITEVGVALSPSNEEAVSRHLRQLEGNGLRIEIAVDEVPRGPAGGIKLFEGLVDGEPFLVVDGGTFLGDVRIEPLFRAHRERGAKATLGVLPEPEPAAIPSARAVFSPDGTLQTIFDVHRSADRRRSRSLAGLGIFDPSVLRLIPDSGYADVKERLVARLQEEGALVAVETIAEHCVPIDSVARYYHLHAALVDSDFVAGNGYRQIADGVWIEEGTEMSPSAYVLGPVLIGRGCRIEDEAHIVGPAVVGDGSRVGARCIVRGSILWEGSDLPRGCKVENSILASGERLSEEAWLRGSLALPAVGGEKRTAALPSPTPLSAPLGKGPSRATVVAKALMDRVGSALFVVLLSPLFLLCAVAIRLDSPGPAFFRQRRCGRGGREFWMFKFRTMFRDADARQAALHKSSDADGPVFKMVADPRITRLGRLLRRTSIDELPQLLNVLRGEMSLVGPRPLAAREMRYCPAWRDRRLMVRPGMTGLWQVSGRSHARFHDWIKYDVEYVKRQSIGLDLRILARTVTAVIRRSGAC